MGERNLAVVVGANGIIGGSLIDHLTTMPGWDVVGLSRRGGPDRGRVRYLAVDLLDHEATRTAVAGLGATTHLFYAAYQDRPSWAGLVAPNMAMLTNVVTAIESTAPGLRHVSLMQGYKVYGAHLGPFDVPAREDDPPHLPPEFNVDQQDFLDRRHRGKDWTWSALRPSVVSGVALGTPMNLTLSIVVYATVCKALGVPLRFPGSPGAYDTLLDVTDAGLLARAALWAATEPAAANQAFNINNGDLLRWRRTWPRIAAFFGLDVAPPLPMSLTAAMADKGQLWTQLAERHELDARDYAMVSAWPFADGVFGWDYPMIANGLKARKAGFTEFVDTEEMFTRHLTELVRRRVIPDPARLSESGANAAPAVTGRQP